MKTKLFVPNFRISVSQRFIFEGVDKPKSASEAPKEVKDAETARNLARYELEQAIKSEKLSPGDKTKYQQLLDESSMTEWDGNKKGMAKKSAQEVVNALLDSGVQLNEKKLNILKAGGLKTVKEVAQPTRKPTEEEKQVHASVDPEKSAAPEVVKVTGDVNSPEQHAVDVALYHSLAPQLKPLQDALYGPDGQGGAKKAEAGAKKNLDDATAHYNRLKDDGKDVEARRDQANADLKLLQKNFDKTPAEQGYSAYLNDLLSKIESTKALVARREAEYKEWQKNYAAAYDQLASLRAALENATAKREAAAQALQSLDDKLIPVMERLGLRQPEKKPEDAQSDHAAHPEIGGSGGSGGSLPVGA